MAPIMRKTTRMIATASLLPYPGREAVGCMGGTAGVTGGAVLQSVEMTLVSIVTAACIAIALPHTMLAPVVKVMLWSARMLPWNAVVVPSVAELPTNQNTLSDCPPLISDTVDPLAVVSVLPT